MKIPTTTWLARLREICDPRFAMLHRNAVRKRIARRLKKMASVRQRAVRASGIATVSAAAFLSSFGAVPVMAQSPTVGDDLLNVSTFVRQTIDGLAGYDVLDYSTLPDGNIFFHVFDGNNTVGKTTTDGTLSAEDTLVGIEEVWGTNNNGTESFLVDGVAYDDVFGVNFIEDGLILDGRGGDDLLLITNSSLLGDITLDEVAGTITQNSTSNVLTYRNFENVSFTFNLGFQFGTDADDFLFGSFNDDQLYGSIGNDILTGNTGYDTLFGNQGKDILTGGAQDDVLFGGAGDDVYVFDPVFHSDVIVESGDIDQISFGTPIAAADVTLSRNNDDLIISAGSQGSIRVIDQYLGGDNAVEYIEFDADGTIVVLPGIDDVPYTPIARDDVVTTLRNQVLNGNATDNNGAGQDIDLNADDVITVLETTITTDFGATVQMNADGSFTYTPLNNVIGVDSFAYTVDDGTGRQATATAMVRIGTHFDDSDSISGGIIDASNNDDEISGHDGTDIVSALPGDDFIFTGGGNDTLIGGPGADYLGAGDGDDLLHATADAWNAGTVSTHTGSPGVAGSGVILFIETDRQFHDVFDGGEGIDTIRMSVDGDALFLDDQFSPNLIGENTPRVIDVENIIAGSGDDIVDLTSRQFTHGDVSIFGQPGNDVLWSNAGDDLLDGGVGNDILDGGAGTDTLIGGTGADSFYLGAADGSTDVITDFSVGENDVLAVYGFLLEFDDATMSLTDFVQFADDGTDTSLLASLAGSGSDFVAVATLEGIIGLAGQEQSLFDANQLLLISSVTLPGDFDGDGDVDGADFLTWQSSFGSTTELNADGNNNGIVDAADYTIWRDNFGVGGNTASGTFSEATVPEPSTFVLFALAGLGISGFSRRRVVR